MYEYIDIDMYIYISISISVCLSIYLYVYLYISISLWGRARRSRDSWSHSELKNDVTICRRKGARDGYFEFELSSNDVMT